MSANYEKAILIAFLGWFLFALFITSFAMTVIGPFLGLTVEILVVFVFFIIVLNKMVRLYSVEKRKPNKSLERDAK